MSRRTINRETINCCWHSRSSRRGSALCPAHDETFCFPLEMRACTRARHCSFSSRAQMHFLNNFQITPDIRPTFGDAPPAAVPPTFVHYVHIFRANSNSARKIILPHEEIASIALLQLAGSIILQQKITKSRLRF